MVEKDVSGVAVIDDEGKLIDNISLRSFIAYLLYFLFKSLNCFCFRDLKGIRPDAKSFWRLWSTVHDFKMKVREEFPGHHIPIQPLVVTEVLLPSYLLLFLILRSPL